MADTIYSGDALFTASLLISGLVISLWMAEHRSHYQAYMRRKK